MFYVYGWFLQNGECFYIGKGTGKRYLQRAHGSQRYRNRIWKSIALEESLAGRRIRTEILHNQLTEEEAFQLEIKLIAELKPRANILEGGEGRRKGWKMPQEAIEKIRKSCIGKKRTPEQRARIKAAALKRGPVSEETRRKMRENYPQHLRNRWTNFPVSPSLQRST